VRVLGIRTVTSPTLIVSSFPRAPLGCVVRSSDRSCMPAPITDVASASISSCSIFASIRRIRSPLSADFRASTTPSRADCFRAIACSPSRVPWRVPAKPHAMAPSRPVPTRTGTRSRSRVTPLKGTSPTVFAHPDPLRITQTHQDKAEMGVIHRAERALISANCARWWTSRG
jgi:hypothetical protein